MNGRNMRKEEKNKNNKKSKKMKDNEKETQQRMRNKGKINKSNLCQQRGYLLLFCCPTTVLKNRV